MQVEVNEFYVYFLIDPRDNEVFYVGKGKGHRIIQHLKNHAKFQTYLDSKNTPEGKEKYKGKGYFSFGNTSMFYRMSEIEKSGKTTLTKKVIEDISEESAFVLEEILVDRFGMKAFGQGALTNLKAGGDHPYLKIQLEEGELTTIEEVRDNYAELLPVLELYPDISKSKKEVKKEIEAAQSKEYAAQSKERAAERRWLRKYGYDFD